MTIALPRTQRRSPFLFDWKAAPCLDRVDQALTAITGQPATFTRASLAAAADSQGTATVAGVHAPAFAWATHPVSGLVEAGLILEASGGGRSADALSFPFLAPPQAMTLYVAFVARAAIGASPATGIVSLGATTNPALDLANDGTGLYAIAHRRASTVTSTAATAPSSGQRVELRAELRADGSVRLGQSLDGGAEALATASSTNALATAWHDTTLRVNDYTGSAPGKILLLTLRIAAGIQSLATMQAG